MAQPTTGDRTPSAAGEAGAPRVVLVETVTPGRFHAGQAFPFAKGLLAARGAAVRWLRLAVPPALELLSGERGVSLAPDEAAAVADAFGADGATHVVFSHRPADSTLAALAAGPRIRPRVALLGVGPEAAGGLTTLPFSARALLAWVGLPAAGVPAEAPDAPDDLTAFSQPDYGFEASNAAAREMTPFVFLLCGQGCAWRARLDGSAFFAAHADAGLPERWGCSFCGDALTDGASGAGGAVAPMELLRRQLLAVARTHPPAPGPLLLRVSGAAVTADPLRLAEQVTALAATLPPCRLLVEYRAAAIVRRADRLEAAARVLAAAGHALDVCLVGVESYSARQLDRFHKGYAPHVNLAAARILRALEAACPEGFGFRAYGGLSTVLYDPWVTIGDVALNVAVARLFGLGKLLGKLLTSRLRLGPGLPLTAAARADGLLTDRHADPLLDTAARNFYDEELPWRFADPRVTGLNRLTTRLPSAPELAGDPLHEELTAWRRAAGLGELEAAARLCEVAAASPEPLPPDELLARARAPRSEPGGPAEDVLVPAEAIAQWLTSSFEYRAFRAGGKPVIKLEDGYPPEIQEALAAALETRHPGVVLRWRQRRWDGGRTRELFAGMAAADVDEALALTEQREDETRPEAIRAAIARTGELLGYPRCCAEAFAAAGLAFLTNNEWLKVRRRLEAPGPVAPELHPFLTSYVPCRLGCAATPALVERLYPLPPDHPGRAYWRWPTLVFLERPGEFAALELLAEPEDEPLPAARTTATRLRYRLGPAQTGDPRLPALARGDTLVVEPGLLRVVADGHEIAWFPLDAFVWWHERVFHPEFWEECVRAVAEGRSAAASDEEQGAAAGERVGGDPAPPDDDPPDAAHAPPAPRSLVPPVALGAAPDAEAPRREALRALLERTLARIAAERPALLQGWRTVDVSARAEGGGFGVLEARLDRDGETLQVGLTAADTTLPFYARTESFAVHYRAATRDLDPDTQRLVELVLRAFERAALGRAARRP
jgi:hypothetical protein